MTCAWIDRDDVFERYVREVLDPDDRDAFEEHFVACAACVAKLELYQALRAELSATPDEASVPAPVRVRVWGWATYAAAASLVLLAALTMWLLSPSAPAPESILTTAPPPVSPAAPAAPASAPLPTIVPGPPSRSVSPSIVPVAVLAHVDPPIYLPLSLRGPRDDAAERFDAAMRRYVEKDYAGAIPDLRAAVALNPKAAHATFFLAICQLLTGDIEASATGLQSTVALGESPYLEEAHFYLAKARLRQGNLAAAREELTRAIARRGRLEKDARQLLAQVNAMIAGK